MLGVVVVRRGAHEPVTQARLAHADGALVALGAGQAHHGHAERAASLRLAVHDALQRGRRHGGAGAATRAPSPGRPATWRHTGDVPRSRLSTADWWSTGA